MTVPEIDVDEVPSDAVVLDVREDDEWTAGRIDGALHVPMMELPSRLAADPDVLDPQTPLVVVCKVGARSAQVTAWLRRQGYDAVNLAGGMLRWEHAGRPLVGDGDGAPYVL